MRKTALSMVSVVLLLGANAAVLNDAQAFNMGNMMNPSRWFNDDDDYYRRGYGYGYGYSYNREYDSDYFIVSTKLYDVHSEKPAWSYLVQVKVEGSKEKAVNQLIPTIVEQLEASKILQ